MPSLTNLIDPEVAAKMRAIATTEGPRYTAEDAVDLDPESEALIEIACAGSKYGCTRTVWLDPTPVPGHEDAPRVPLCKACATEATKGKRGQVIRRPRVAKHQPRTSDGIDHPVTTHHQEDTPMIDIGTMSDAQLGQMLREKVTEKKAAEAKVERPKAVKAKKDKAKKVEKERVAERAARVVLPAFVVDAGLTVPELDLRDASLDEVVSATERRPYNQARWRFGEGPLPAPRNAEDEDDGTKPTTWGDLMREHRRLGIRARLKQAEVEAKKAAKPKKKGKKVEAIVAVVDEDVLAKRVKALRKVRPDLSKEQAREVVTAALGV